MKNYWISNISPQVQDFPSKDDPEVKNRMKSLHEYLEMAQKVLNYFAPHYFPSNVVYVLSESEDAISEIAMHLMLADWSWDERKGRNERSYRNYRGDRKINKLMQIFKTAANKELQSLDKVVANEKDSYRYVGNLVYDPEKILIEKERSETISKYVRYLITHSGLTPMQKRCVELKYVEGVETGEEIGKQFTPVVSRQNINEILEKAILKMKQTALGTNNEFNS